MTFVEKKCQPCEKGTAPMSTEQAQLNVREIPGWALKDNSIERDFKFKDFRAAMVFVNAAARVANEEDHHPDIFISYNKVRITLTTHAIGGLSINDFIVAAKVNRIAGEAQTGEL